MKTSFSIFNGKGELAPTTNWQEELADQTEDYDKNLQRAVKD